MYLCEQLPMTFWQRLEVELISFELLDFSITLRGTLGDKLAQRLRGGATVVGSANNTT